jgi:hypothetical protein
MKKNGNFEQNRRVFSSTIEPQLLITAPPCLTLGTVLFIHEQKALDKRKHRRQPLFFLINIFCVVLNFVSGLPEFRDILPVAVVIEVRTLK